MKRELLSKAFGDIDDRYVLEAYRPCPEDARSASERSVHMKKKQIITLGLAATLAFALGITACAVWGVHAARQEALKTALKIDENHVTSYMEYEVSEDPAAGLVLLSAVSDGQEQRVYADISPISEEEAAAYMEKVLFTCGIDGTSIGGSAVPVLPAGQAIGSDEMAAAVAENAYDRETQTLTLQCFLDVHSVEEAMQYLGTETMPLTVHMFVDGQPARDFGPVDFRLTEEQLRTFDFDGAVYHDPKLDMDVEIVGLDLTPFGAVWKIHYDGDDTVHAVQSNWEVYRPWCLMEDRTVKATKIVFSDGTELSFGALNAHYANGTVNLWYGWQQAVNIGGVQRIVLGDTTLWEAE